MIYIKNFVRKEKHLKLGYLKSAADMELEYSIIEVTINTVYAILFALSFIGRCFFIATRFSSVEPS
jgi:hypothetical protein